MPSTSLKDRTSAKAQRKVAAGTDGTDSDEIPDLPGARDKHRGPAFDDDNSSHSPQEQPGRKRRGSKDAEAKSKKRRLQDGTSEDDGKAKKGLVGRQKAKMQPKSKNAKKEDLSKTLVSTEADDAKQGQASHPKSKSKGRTTQKTALFSEDEDQEELDLFARKQDEQGTHKNDENENKDDNAGRAPVFSDNEDKKPSRGRPKGKGRPKKQVRQTGKQLESTIASLDTQNEGWVKTSVDLKTGGRGKHGEEVEKVAPRSVDGVQERVSIHAVDVDEEAPDQKSQQKQLFSDDESDLQGANNREGNGQAIDEALPDEEMEKENLVAIFGRESFELTGQQPHNDISSGLGEEKIRPSSMRKVEPNMIS